MATVKAGSAQDKRWAKLIPESVPQKKKQKPHTVKPTYIPDPNIAILEKEIENLSLENEQLRKKYTAEKQKNFELTENLKMFNAKIDRLQKQVSEKPKAPVRRSTPPETGVRKTGPRKKTS